MTEALESGKPRIIHRNCGGWIALSPLGSDLQIGITAATEQEAKDKYARSEAECRRLLSKPTDEPSSASGTADASSA